MTTRKRITAAFLALFLLLSMMPVSLAADEEIADATQEVVAETPVEQLPEEASDDTVDLCATTTAGTPALVYRCLDWNEAGELVEYEYYLTSWDCPIDGSSRVRFYFFDGTSYTLVDVENLVVSDNIVTLTVVDDHIRMMSNNFGKGTVSYLAPDSEVYSITVEVVLPTLGFYTSTVASEESYIDSFTFTQTDKTFYFVCTNGWSINSVTLYEDFDAIADAEVSADGTYVTITLTGEPEDGTYYRMICEITTPWGDTYAPRYSIELKNGMPGLRFRYMSLDSTKQVYYEDPNRTLNTRCDSVISSASYVKFYYVEGDTCTAVGLDQLVLSENGVVTLTAVNGYDHLYMRLVAFGEGTICYTAEDGVTYSVTVTVSLPNYGFYTDSTPSEEGYIEQFSVTEENNVFYFSGANGNTVSSVTLNDDFDEIADVEFVDGQAIITITGAPEDGDLYKLSYSGTYSWGSEFTNSSNSIRLYNQLPGLVYRAFVWSNGEPTASEATYSKLTTSLGNEHALQFYLYDGKETYTMIGLDELTVEDDSVISLVQNSIGDFLRIIPQGCGSTTIRYNAPNGKTYTFPITVGLPLTGNYSEPIAEDTYFLANGFTVTDTCNTYYVIGSAGVTFSSVTLYSDLDAIADAELAEDGSYIKITVTGNPEGRWYYMELSGTRANGNTFTGRRHGTPLYDGTSKLVFRNTWYENNEYVETTYNRTSWSATPGRAQGRFYLFDGETYTRVYASDLTVGDTDVAYLTDSADQELSYINAIGFGETTVEYTSPKTGKVVSFPISVALPSHGFYSTPIPTEDSYIRSFLMTKNRTVFYLAVLDGWTIREVSLMSGLSEIATAEISEDGSYVTITLVGAPENREYAVNFYVDSPYGWSSWYWEEITLDVAKPRLVYRYAHPDENGIFYEDEQAYFDAWSSWKGSGNYLCFYAYDGDSSYTPVSLDQLTVTGDAVSLKMDEAAGYIYAHAEQLGGSRIYYTGEDGTIYSLTAEVDLPPYGFYSSSERSVTYYVEEYAVSNEDNKVYFLTDDSYTIAGFTLSGELSAIATAELIGDHCLAITVNELPADAWYGLSVKLTHQNGESFTETFEIRLSTQPAYLTGKIYLPNNLDDAEFSIRLSDDLDGYAMIAVNADTIQSDANGKYVSYELRSPAEYYGCTTSVSFTLVDYEGSLLNNQTHYARIPYVSADGSLVYGGFYNTPYIQIPADEAYELNFTLPTWDDDTSDVLAESDHGVTELSEFTHTHTAAGAKGFWLHFDPRTDLESLTINDKLHSLAKLYGDAIYVDASSTSGKLTIFCGAATFDAPVFGYAITSIEAVYTTAAKDVVYTLRTDDVISSNWNPHTWALDQDSTVLSYVMAPLCELTVKDSTTTEYQWIFVAAESITDVTADHQDDLSKYGCAEGKATEGYVYEIKLNPEMCWEDGTPINADTYLYSMERLLSSELDNSRASDFVYSDYALAGAENFHYSGTVALLDNSLTGAITALSDLTKCEDGMYRTAAGLNVHIALTAGLEWLGGYSLADYVNAYGNAYFDADAYNALYALADENGNVALTAETWALLTDVISNPNWGEGPGYEINYLYYEHKYPTVTFDCVGLYKVDDYTIRYVCATAYDYYYFLTACTSNWLVHEGMYEYCLEYGLPYNGTAATSMSCGPYTVEMADDTTMTLVRNEAYWEYDLDENGNITSTTFFEVDGEYVSQFVTDRIVITNMSDEEAAEAYLNGELDVWKPWGDQLLDYTTSDRLYQEDETYTMRLFFHTNLDSLKKMDQKGNTNSVVLSNAKFREAMSLSINRAEFATATAGYKAAYSLLNSLYYYDVYGDPTSIYRNTDQAKEAICNLYGISYGPGTEYATLDEAYASITGYNPTKAKELFAQACAELVAAGLYKEGEPIVIELAWMAGTLDTANRRQVALLNKSLNEALEGTGFGSIELKAVDNLRSRYEDVYNGVYAIGWGAWGGAAFYPFTMFRVYCDPSYVSYIHEGGCWDPASETLTLTINGEEVTMTWQKWSTSMTGIGKYANADNETKLTILAALEEHYLGLYYCIPLCTTTSCNVLSSKIDWYTHNYNSMYGFGGVRLMKYNYSDPQEDDSTEESKPDHRPPMDTPELKVSEDSAGRPKLLWSYVPGAKHYEVHRADSKDGPFTHIVTTEHIDFVDESAEGGRTYYYIVRAISDDRESEFTDPVHGSCRHVASGSCGDNVYWQLTTDGTLLIHGNGEMLDYAADAPGPWMNWRTSIKKVVIGDGITHVGQYAFHGGFGHNEESAEPHSIVNPISTYTFSTASTTTLTTASDSTTVEVVMGSSVTSIGTGAFAQCTEVAEIVFTGEVAPTLEDSTALPEEVTVYHTEEAADSWAEVVTEVAVQAVVMTAPEFVTNATDDTFTAGDTLTLSISDVTGSPSPTQQWQYSTDGIIWTNISGATGTTYTITDADFPNSGYYRCVVSNEVGTVVGDTIRYSFQGEEIEVDRDGATVTVKVRNMKSESRTGFIYCAAYDTDGRMIDLIAFRVTIAAGGQFTETDSFTTTGEIADVRVFFVASGSYVPYCSVAG